MRVVTTAVPTTAPLNTGIKVILDPSVTSPKSVVKGAVASTGGSVVGWVGGIMEEMGVGTGVEVTLTDNDVIYSHGCI